MRFEIVDNKKANDMRYTIAKTSEFGDIILPKRADKGSAGYDFYSPISLFIRPKEKVLIWTNIKCKLANDEVLLLFPRSSLATKKGLVLSNTIGVIDASYYNNIDNEGNIGISLYNSSDVDIKIETGDRIVQGIVTKFITAEDDNVEGERKGGFGSSGT